MSIERFVEEQVRRAMERGEFEDLPGRGRPIDLEAYFNTPADLRMGYSILKNNNFVPEEVQLLKEVEALKEELAACADEARRRQLHKSIKEKTLNFTVLMEKHRRTK
ncbi:MAG TPA: DUF1992 domain-containing protein [Pyrinomonadaceae bacterium]|nr:DUF1992 domain-containing protein [Pyrinomonadaceae bacterium]